MAKQILWIVSSVNLWLIKDFFTLTYLDKIHGETVIVLFGLQLMIPGLHSPSISLVNRSSVVPETQCQSASSVAICSMPQVVRSSKVHRSNRAKDESKVQKVVFDQ